MSHLSKKIHAIHHHAKLDQSAEDLAARQFANVFPDITEILTNVDAILSVQLALTALSLRHAPTTNVLIHVLVRFADIMQNVLPSIMFPSAHVLRK